MEVMESETAIASKVQRLRCSVQNYDWGRKGVDSTVAELYALNSGSEIDPEKPYAEIWMGTHDSGPSFLVPSEHKSNGNLSVEFGSHGESLKSWISKNPSVLGEKVVQRWGSDLPFLFKVLFYMLFEFPLDFWLFQLVEFFNGKFSWKSVWFVLGAFGGQGIVNTSSSG